MRYTCFACGLSVDSYDQPYGGGKVSASFEMGYDNDKSTTRTRSEKFVTAAFASVSHILPASRRLDEVVIHLEGKHSHLCREQQHRKAPHPSSRTDATKNF
jgi:hypothetical protein